MVSQARAVRERITVQLPDRASAKQYRELGAFVRYCVLRVERELGPWESWAVRIASHASAYTTYVAVSHDGHVLEGRGAGQDGALAIWDAMCRIEQTLREHRYEARHEPLGELPVSAVG